MHNKLLHCVLVCDCSQLDAVIAFVMALETVKS